MCSLIEVWSERIMSQDYLYAVQRAELLGQPPPTEEEWAASQKKAEVEAEEHDNAVAQVSKKK